MSPLNHTALGIPDDIYASALRVMGHPWRKGQRCSGWQSCRWRDHHRLNSQHDIPIPPVTGELLWQMLVKGLEQDMGFWTKIGNKLHPFRKDKQEDTAAAVIRATASLEVK